ncbi:hypothetical protein DR864_28095 [Runella rosea]|uniref:Uncharacterized protein n=1 Tax=Runella rosea TaxID=2259595 RepID=A0A344TRQ5_9BACT|nr:hypothetical protein [Runella rosea]AXE16259.1 hypothetical protein DR864_00230 [Runella rosea]AXE21326.1 hypothetical protein DR864_28095 [Runella rosea]
MKLSNERDTLKKMFADSLVKHRFERVSWTLSTKEQVKASKKTGRKQGFRWGVFGVLGAEALVAIYFLTR